MKVKHSESDGHYRHSHSKSRGPVNSAPVTRPSRAIAPIPSLSGTTNLSENIILSVPALEPIDGVPRGLECFFGVNRIFLKREKQEWPDGDQSITNFNNRFSLLNQAGHRILFMGENKVHTWNCAPSSFRPFLLHFFDPEGNLVMTAERLDSSKLSFWGADIAGNDIIVELRTCDSQILGQVEQQFGNCCCSTQGFFNVLDGQEKPVFGIDGSWAGKVSICCCDLHIRRHMDVNLALLDKDGATLIDPLLLRDEDDPEDSPFGIQMPADIDCAMKAVLVAFLADIYITYYEGNRKVNYRIQHHHPYGGTVYENPGRQGCTGWQCCSLALCVLGFLVAVVLFVALLLFLAGEFDDKRRVPN